MALVRTLAVLTLCLATAGCSGAASSGPAASTGTPSSGSSSSTGPTKLDWCYGYSTLTTALAQASPDPSGASTALDSLTNFDLLWDGSVGVGILTADEAAANRRAVASYRAVVEAESNGMATDSPEMAAARAALTAQTERDRALLTSSASKVLAACGAVTESPSA